MKTVAIIQARMGSTRLPGKVMMELRGRPVLAHVVDRVRACASVDEVVVATTTSPSDDVIAALATREGAGVFRGCEEDVLSRYHQAAEQARADHVVRVTSDCPLFDPGVLGSMLEEYFHRRRAGEALDYMSNTLSRTFPRGLDAEVFTFDALAKANAEASLQHEREHVTPYLYGHPELFRLGEFQREGDLSHHRWTLDTPEDWELIRRVYAATAQDGSPAALTMDGVLELLARHPDWTRLNAHIEQK